MFIELLDTLRCVASHEDTWLVASFDRMDNRRVVDGTLGCPVCRAVYQIRDGVAWLGAGPDDLPPGEAPLTAAVLEHEALRLAALLHLREPGTRAVVTGSLAQ